MAELFSFIAAHPILVSIFVILLVLFIVNETKRGGKAVTAQELVHMMNKEKAVVLDVRDSSEYSSGHIVNALNIPYSALSNRIPELEKFKNRPVVVACKMGQHSGMAGTILRKAGFTNVLRLRGGLTEWRNLNMPVVKG